MSVELVHPCTSLNASMSVFVFTLAASFTTFIIVGEKRKDTICTRRLPGDVSREKWSEKRVTVGYRERASTAAVLRVTSVSGTAPSVTEMTVLIQTPLI